ncbi:ferritin-like domain-containing protein [Flavobacterium urumqiense]|uniref:Uncharacterized protein n=1 Tax=Flavobacterium urumqiense TaxID=935224 RepID=A0A1H5V9D8_9FLAO|nr:DUF892 family protein [Flavobacterium urumqiense]SEF83381.1 protein of unknown function [Flavobacterium urumqiense]
MVFVNPWSHQLFPFAFGLFLVRPNAVAQSVAQLQGILKEVDGLIKETDIGVVRNAGIIAAEQKVKHYEIATYGTLHAFAKTLGENKAANLLAMTVDKKKKTDATLTGIAMSTINKQACKTDTITNIKA